MSVHKILSDLLGIIGFFVLVPAYILVPTEMKISVFSLQTLIFLVLSVCLLAFSYFASKAKKEMTRDERMISIS
jgi:hypothetical protein